MSISDEKNIWETTKKCNDITYWYSSLLTQQFKESGLITKEEKGRTKLIRLTEKGEELQKLFNKLLRQLRG